MTVQRQSLTDADLGKLAWQKGAGLLPCVVQHALTGQVLMLGYMTRESAAMSLQSGKVTFFSRSKQRLWCKGESSGHFLLLQHLYGDCDDDSLLALALPEGPTCHLGSNSCFTDQAQPTLALLQQTITERATNVSDDSYTATLLQGGVKRVAQKVGEEGVEVALAAVAEDDQSLCNEAADLLYHLLVTLQARQLSLTDVLTVLQQRQR
ncbi:bifunctional phosphoribosyl-AMP cyclohydrolase/phosphoribosyl-ATP diphosphatase HisIE [Idiomarina xiamenensis]|uniref:Histidine biosynthesis bifunctional protein HisIE n=1 Tax=Idiomarina xiamenensis 10-D-4 TaxID=740709 RepID=K2JHJ6_9GAMM|nr:bifunctional phosphoribosyl-AMP cyclohydrolase/phosphoribosyl-ATP diphosphatase HisIE [Idiomarina xiamenensis]EKE82836.1 phosphoribosyl-AMP cyclohydrolase [Idiomarina xiamenensis 10-D-4]